MTDQPMAARDMCEHQYEYRIRGGHPINVPTCMLCRTPDWADLDEQAAELYQWGWQEGRDGKTAREKLSAYDKPRQAHNSPHAPQDGPQRPDAGAETPDGAGGRQTGAGGGEVLREPYAAAIAELPYYERDDAGSIADAVLAVRDREMDRMKLLVAASESPGHAVRMAAQYAERTIENGQRADQLATTLRQALDAFEAYWARASYCGPGDSAIQPEHLQAWRAVLNGKEQP